MLEPLKDSLDRLDGLDVDPGHRDVGAQRYSARMNTVIASFLRMSATLKAVRIVASTTDQVRARRVAGDPGGRGVRRGRGTALVLAVALSRAGRIVGELRL